MRHLMKAAMVLGVLALVAGPVVAGPGCAHKANKAGAGCSAQGMKAESNCGFMQVLTAGSGCCGAKGEHAKAFQALNIDIVETPDGYMAVASVSNSDYVNLIQKMVRNGWDSIVKSKGEDSCGLCKEMYAFVNQGAEVEIYNTTAGAIVVARASEKKVVDGLHAYAAKIRVSATTETQG